MKIEVKRGYFCKFVHIFLVFSYERNRDKARAFNRFNRKL